jgi:hypothetical protein
MIIFLPVALMLLTALTLVILRFARPGFKYPWMVAIGGATLAFASVLAWQIDFPKSFSLPPWQPSTVFRYSPIWLADGTSWPYALALAALAAAVIWTSVVRLENEPLSWAGTLLLCSLGILAVTAGNPLTLVLTWSALDLAELITMLRSTEGEAQNQSVAIALATRLGGTGLVLVASTIHSTSGGSLDFRLTPGSVGIYLLMAAGLRLGVLPLHLPYRKENVLRRGLGTTLRLVSAAASLSLLARIPPSALESRLPPYLLILAAITALYAGWMWLRASDEVIGRPFWVLGLASLAVAASLRGNPAGSTGWGTALVLSGGLLFLFSARQRSILWIMLAGLWGASALPFSLTAAGWSGVGASSWALMLPFPVAQALLLAGFVRHTLHPGETSLESQEKWVQVIYPTGLLVMGGTIVLLGLWGWPGALVTGPWLTGAIAVLLAAVFVVLASRLLVRLTPGSDSAQWVRIFRLGWLYALLAAVFRWLGWLADLITRTLEGEGGLLWSFLLLVLIISVLSTRGQP